VNHSRMQKLHKECWEKVISGKDEEEEKVVDGSHEFYEEESGT